MNKLEAADWSEPMDEISEADAKRIVKTHGTSCHTPIRQRCLACYKDGMAVGKGAIGMNILGVGKLRYQVAEALQFALGRAASIVLLSVWQTGMN